MIDSWHIELEKGTSIRVHSEANDWLRRGDSWSVQMGVQNSWQERRKWIQTQLMTQSPRVVTLGRRHLQVDDGIHRGLPKQAAQMQVQSCALPSEYLPFGNSLPINSKRRRRLETIIDNSLDLARHPRFDVQPKWEESSPSWSLRGLHPEQAGIHQACQVAGRAVQTQGLTIFLNSESTPVKCLKRTSINS